MKRKFDKETKKDEKDEKDLINKTKSTDIGGRKKIEPIKGKHDGKDTFGMGR